MKKLLPVLLALGLLFVWHQSREPEVLHLGCNAIILSVDPEGGTVTVTDPAEQQLFGDNCILSAEGDEMEVVYCDFETQVLTVISLEDLQPGDAITVNAYKSELEKASSGAVSVQQIQLMTQRHSDNTK